MGLDSLRYAPAFRLSPHVSAILVDWIFGAIVFFVVVLSCVRALRAYLHARALDEEVWKRRGLRNGPVLLGGVVAAIDDAGTPLVEVRITQEGRAYSTRNGNFVRWTEIDRTITDRPFLLTTDGGTKLRVELGARIELNATLEPGAARHGHARERIARIVDGSRVWVRGKIDTRGSVPGAGPYRGGGDEGITLRPLSTAPLFVSAVPVGDEDRASARFHGGFAIAWLALFALLQGVFFGPFRALRARGVVDTAVVTRHSTFITRSKSTTTEHYVLSLRYRTDVEVADADEETTFPIYGYVKDGDHVPIVYDALHPATIQLGRFDETGTTSSRLTFAALLAIVLAVTHWKWSSTRRPWWRRKQLVEIEKGVL